jgi:hypothetical protein
MDSLFNIFEPGGIISTKGESKTDWVTNSIVNIDKDTETIEISLKKEYVEDLLNRGEKLAARVTLEESIVIAEGIIEEITNYKTVKLQIITINMIKNKREEPRYEVNYKSIIKSIEIKHDNISRVKDISKSGLGIVSSENLPVGSEIFIDIFIDESNILKLKGCTVRKNALGYNIEYGLLCNPIDERNAIALDKLLKELENRNNESSSILKRLRARMTATQ